MKKLIPSIVLLHLVLLALFTVLVIAVHLIPRDAIEPQFKSSVKNIFTEEGVYPDKTSLDGSVLVDNFTDCYMLNVAYCADASHPVDAAMRNYRYRDDANMVVTMNHLADGKMTLEPTEYGKYWHGYQVFLRPLLALMDYGKIRVLNGIMLAILLITALTLMARRLSPGIPICFAVSMFMVHSGVLPWSLQFSTCYYITLVSVIALLGFGWLSATWHRLVLCFFAIGAVTSFLDFFTTPVMTLGVPLTVMVLKDERLCRMRAVFALCLAWLAGYSLMWASKWVMAYLLAGYNPLEEVTLFVQIHTIGQDTEPVQAFWKKMLDLFLSRWSLMSANGLMRWGIVAVLAIPAILFSKGRNVLKNYSVLLFVAMLTPLWYIVVAHHSYTHFFITMRALLVCWFSSLCFLYQNIDFSKLKTYFCKR